MPANVIKALRNGWSNCEIVWGTGYLVPIELAEKKKTVKGTVEEPLRNRQKNALPTR